MEEDKVLFGIVELNEAQRMIASLVEKGVVLEIRHDKKTCQSGCRVTVELWGQKDDFPKLAEFLHKEQLKLFDGLDIKPDLINQVFDVNTSEATCPACGTKFSTSNLVCPDCGLNFG